jgi:hypothetical protein
MKSYSFIYIIVTGILLLFTSLNDNEETYYYAFDKKVALFPKPNTILVKYVEGVKESRVDTSIKTLSTDFSIKWHDSLTKQKVNIKYNNSLKLKENG